jgi:hypothetical protein
LVQIGPKLFEDLLKRVGSYAAHCAGSGRKLEGSTHQEVAELLSKCLGEVGELDTL